MVRVSGFFLAIALACAAVASAQTPIHQIQGNGARSPLAGTTVTTRGVVTGIRSNGFFIQTPDAEIDADPATSEGILVFTGSPPPSAAAIGNLVQVSGAVVEFVPSADPNSPPLTEIGGSVSVALLSSGVALPAPVTLTSTEDLERLEGMRVRVASLIVISPTGGSISETNASSTSNGVFYGVLARSFRPFREPGIAIADPLPPAAPCCIPRFDGNPERLRIDSDAQPGAVALDVAAGEIVSGIVGPLDFSFRTYTILPDAAARPAATVTRAPAAVSIPARGEFTVAAWNLQRFFDDANDPLINEPVLTAAAWERRLGKASTAIRDLLRLPDIVAVAEVENLATLRALAERTSPLYDAYVEDGNDPGGIDVGFLVNRSRVTVSGVVQEGKGTTFTNPAGTQETLHDRPPLRLSATIRLPDGQAFPLTVIAVHLRSLNGIDDTADGPRVRAKRQKQAEAIAALVQARQTADPGERIVILGDFNAFEFSDGYVDVMGTISGTPAPPEQVLVASPDLVQPDLRNMTMTAFAVERYSFVFDGNAQALDHVVVNRAMLEAAHAIRIERARLGADFPESARNDAASPARSSDHDPAVAFIRETAPAPRRRAM